MKQKRLAIVAVCAFLVAVGPVAAHDFSAQDRQAIAAAQSLSNAFAAVARHVKPAVVNISTTRAPTGPTVSRGGREVRSLGSGAIISPDGMILTNNHVVANASEITVTLADDSEYPGRVLGTDPATDLAVIKIEARGLPYLEFADSASLEVGEWVVAVGSPFGLSQTVTTGIVSATGRTDIGILGYEDLIQTDAAINPGNSGGPLVNLWGELVGVNTAIASRSGSNAGVGFAVPSNRARLVSAQLANGQPVERGWIGIIPRDLSPQLASRHAGGITTGVFVEGLYRAHPAIAAGIQPGDVIVSYAGETVNSVGVLSRMVADSKVGSQVPLTVRRGTSEQTIRVAVAKQPVPNSGQRIRGL